MDVEHLIARLMRYNKAAPPKRRVRFTIDSFDDGSPRVRAWHGEDEHPFSLVPPGGVHDRPSVASALKGLGVQLDALEPVVRSDLGTLQRRAGVGIKSLDGPVPALADVRMGRE